MEVSGSSGLSLLMSAYTESAPSSPESYYQDPLEEKGDLEFGEEMGSPSAFEGSSQEEEVDGTDGTKKVEMLEEEEMTNSFEQEYTEDMFESYDGFIDTPPNSVKSNKHTPHRHSIYATKIVEPKAVAKTAEKAKIKPLENGVVVRNVEVGNFSTVSSLSDQMKETIEGGSIGEETVQETSVETVQEMYVDGGDFAIESLNDHTAFTEEESKDLAYENSDMNPGFSSQDEEEVMSINKSSFSRNNSLGSIASSSRADDMFNFTQEDSMSSLSQDSEAYGLQRHDSNLSISSTPVIKEEIIEYTDGAGQYFYVPPDESLDAFKPDGPTYLPEQEFTALDGDLLKGIIWNKDDSNFSSILHNLGLVHKDAAGNISKLPAMQRSKLSVLLKSWSDQRSFTDCLIEMTDCDHFYDPIGYDTVLVTDPCMSAKYDFLSDGMHQHEVERKQLDEFYNFTEEKSFFFQKCKVCSKLFSNTFGLRQHIAHMHPGTNMDEVLKKDEGIFSCLKCKRTFNSQAQLKKHFQKSHIPKASINDMNFKCSHCGEYFKTRVLLHRHTSEKHRNRTKTEAAELHEPWSCEMCKSIFYKKSNFLKHMQKVHGKMKVSERLLNSAKLSAQLSAQLVNQKQREQSSPKPTKVKDEPKEKRTSRSSKKLEFSEDSLPEKKTPSINSDRSTPIPTEIQVEEKPEPEKPTELSPDRETKMNEINVTCLFCKLCFVSYTDLQLHCADVHREANKIILLKMFTIIGSQPHGINFQCILCTKISPTPPIALGHLENTHLNDQPEISDHLEKQNPPVKKPSYISPKLTDFDGLSLMCRFCQKTFKNSKIKRKHEKSVHNDQSIVCFYCFIPILNRTELTKHIKTEHSGSKSLFKCRWCDAHFTSIPKRCSHMKEFHSSDVANITNRTASPLKPVTVTPEKAVSLKEVSGANMCTKCNISFPSLELKNKHDRYIHNEVEINCLYCFASFKNKESLIQHIAVYHLAYHKKPYKCKWCEITFETLYQRSLHMKHSHDVLSASSSPLSTSAPQVTPDSSMDDSFVHSSINKSLTFSDDSLRQPASVFPKETSKLVRNCRFCDAEVTSMILKKHLIEHRQWDHFVCIFCDKTVPTIGGIKSHILRNHPFITTRKMDRSELGSDDIERVASIERLHNADTSSRRVNVVGMNEPPPPRISPEAEIIFPCQVCFFLFTITHHVEDHWRVHSDEPNEEWTCTLCDEQYGEFRSFKFHIEMHRNDAFTFAQSTVDIQNICGFCNITVETQQSLDGHILIHRSVEQFNCIFCKAKSGTFRDMKEHITQNHMNTHALPNDPSRHLNETPFNSSTFKCSVCLKLCNNQFNLNSHTKAHILGGKPCTLCNFKFKDMATLKNHLLLVHGAPEEYIAALESNTASRSDAVADYCELCDKSFSSQGKFQKHRKACRDRFKMKNSNSQDNALYSLLENSSSSDRSRQNSEIQPTEVGQSAPPVVTITEDHQEAFDNESENELADNMNQSSLDELENLPMEIPMKSTTDGALCPSLPISPHSYNTRKRPRPESYANIIPAKMLTMPYSEYSRQNCIAPVPKKEISPPRKMSATAPLAPQHEIAKSVSALSGTPSMVARSPNTVTVTDVSNARSEDPQPVPAAGTETMYCDVCELNFASHKQLYWHKHTKRHLAMELLAKGPTAVSHGKHLCDQCDQGYNCKKQLHWHKKIAHDGRTNIAEIVLRQLPQPRVGTLRSPEALSEILSDPMDGNLSSLVKLADNDVSVSIQPFTETKPVIKDNDSEKATESTTVKPGMDSNYPLADKPQDLAADESKDLDESFVNPMTEETENFPPLASPEKPQSVVEVSNRKRTPGVPIAGPYFCELCNLTYKSHKQLYNHKRTLSHIQLAKKYDPTYTEVYYSCDECHIDFQSYKQLWNHKKSLQHKEISDKMLQNPAFNADISKTNFGGDRADGESSPETKKNFVCLDCDCVFEDKKQMKWHKKTWSHKTITIVPPPNAKQEEEKPPPPREPRLPPKCSRGMICTTENPCRHHEIKEENAPYYCQECKLPFRALRSYTVHCKQHLKEGFKCTLCNQKFQFKNYNNVKRHLTNIHKIAGDRTKNYMETFHNFDQNAQPLRQVNPDDLVEGVVLETAEAETKVKELEDSESIAGEVKDTEVSVSEPASPRSNFSRSPGFIEGLLVDVGLSLEICERKPEWIESAKCKFCKIDFENVPEMLLHAHEEHDKNYHKGFLSQFITPEDTVNDSSSDEDDSDTDDSDESDFGVLTGDRDHGLSDVEADEEPPSSEDGAEAIYPAIRIKRPGESLTNGVVKKQKLGFGSKVAATNSTLGASSANSTPSKTPEPTTPEIPEEMFGESVHGPKRQYACILCNTGFTVYLAWWYHSKLEHNFSNVGYYGGSADSKLPGGNYESSSKKNVKAECPECHAVFNQRLLLENHLKVHRKPKIFQCDFCCKKFNSCKNASRHRLKCHSVVVNGRKCYLCKSCEKHFPRADDLIEHVQEQHDSAPPTFCCATCGKVYNKESTFVSHIRECEPESGSGRVKS